MESKADKNVVYVWNKDYLEKCDEWPKVPNRASMVHSLITAYGLLSKMRLINPRPASDEEITQFHSHDYLEFLKNASEQEDIEKLSEEAEQYGLSYDCPPFAGVFDYAAYVCGATIKAAQALVLGICDVAINWSGGWHHAKRDEAAGFCYLNDIVLGILTLRKKYSKVLYVDIDLHHGDGVEDAFCATSKVMCISFHNHSPGFFPGTGDLPDVGLGKGKYYSVNVPLRAGITDALFFTVFKNVMDMVHASYEPDAVVCQCGADGLTGDPHQCFNLSHDVFVRCVQHLRDWKLPLLLVGGGGYNAADTARCWTTVTASVLNTTLPQEIPEHQYFIEYGPDYQLDVGTGNRMDRNDKDYINSVISQVKDNLENVR